MPASGSMPPRPTASRFRSRSSIGKTSAKQARIPSTSTATAPTAIRLPLGFSSNRLSLLDRGVVMAYAHIRGGGDLGKPWHDAGKMLVKRNTFTDFIAAVEHLTAAGYGDPRALRSRADRPAACSWARSPTFARTFSASVLSHVPFVDVMNTMLDASLPLTVPEYEEWGDPNEEDVLSLHAELLALRQLEARKLSGDVGQDHRCTTAR